MEVRFNFYNEEKNLGGDIEVLYRSAYALEDGTRGFAPTTPTLQDRMDYVLHTLRGEDIVGKRGLKVLLESTTSTFSQIPLSKDDLELLALELTDKMPEVEFVLE